MQIYNEWKSDLDEIFGISFKIYLDNNLIIELISKNSFAIDIKISQDLFIESNSTSRFSECSSISQSSSFI